MIAFVRDSNETFRTGVLGSLESKRDDYLLAG